MNKLRLIFDIECDTLLEDVKHMWVLVTKDLDTQEIRVFKEGDLSWQSYLYNATTLVGHNIINYDLNVLKKLFSWIPNPETALHDTLLFSQMLNFRRFGFKGHSLEVWGQAMGDHKIHFEDWTHLSDEMITYCIQDVNLSHKVYKYLGNEFTNAVKKNKLLQLSMRNEHAAARFMAEAELIGWSFNKPKAIQLYWKMQEEILETEALIEPLMGKKTIITDRLTYNKLIEEIMEDPETAAYKIVGFSNIDSIELLGTVGVAKFPKWNKKGYYYAHIANWFNIPADQGLYTDCLVEGPYCRVEFKDRKLSSTDDAKEWLRTLGWEADDWNFKFNPETKKQEIVSEKISESSLLKLGELGEKYNSYLTTNSRANILYGWIEACDTEWRIHGGAMCFGTPTGRMTHKIIANVPSVDSIWGKDVRSLFMADPGTIIIGCDSSGNQMRAFCHHLGNQEFTDQVISGDIHQANANTLTKVAHALNLVNDVSRKQAKTFIYAYLFGVGNEKAALYITGKRDAVLGGKIKAGFAENIVGLADLVSKLEKVYSSTKKDTGFGYIYGVDGSKIYSDSFHKVLNYLLQRFESVTVKSAIYHMAKKLTAEGIWWQPLIINHDEVQFLVKDNAEIIARAEEIAHWAFKDAAQEFNVMITDGEAKHGYNWAETH